jgi:RimJ/RimL family protein N-acetyltransferase
MPTDRRSPEPVIAGAVPCASSRVLEGERILLRPWRESDREPFARLNADPRVMEHFPALQTREESDASVARFEAHRVRHGFCLWALEVKGVAPFVGMVGLNVPRFEAHFTPCVEIGWRLAAEHWGHGYAVEGARVALSFAFGELALEEVVSFTTTRNVRSRRVMEKLGMRHDIAGDFDHPGVPEGHPLRRHVLYRLRAQHSTLQSSASGYICSQLG